MKATETKRIKKLVQKIACIKRLLADDELDKAMLKELAEANIRSRGATLPCKVQLQWDRAVCVLQDRF
jgi:hypothetical protein